MGECAHRRERPAQTDGWRQLRRHTAHPHGRALWPGQCRLGRRLRLGIAAELCRSGRFCACDARHACNACTGSRALHHARGAQCTHR
jgi:hypothetical protein